MSEKVTPTHPWWRGIIGQPVPFLLGFLILSAITVRIHYQYPIDIGQDFHYHLMNAALNGRSSSDPVGALYHWMNPFDSNTLLYTIAWPFEKLTNPVRAFQIACTITYWIGYPVGCAYALIRTGRSPWGSLLAFPLSYSLNSLAGGYWPFLAAATFIAPALAEMEIMQRSRGEKRQNAGIACALLVVLAFLGHAVVFAWLAVLLALHTMALMIWEFGIDGLGGPIAGLRRAFWPGVRSLLVMVPATLLAMRWYWHVTYGSARAEANLPMAQLAEPTLVKKLSEVLDWVAPTTNENETWYIAALAVVSLIALLSGERANRAGGPKIFERSYLVTFASFIVFPYWFHYESTSPRQFDLAMLMLPLVLFPKRPRLRSPATFAIAIVFIFSVMRVRVIGEQLKILNTVDHAGLLQAAETCKRVVPKDRARLVAYANHGTAVSSFKSSSAHQAHETFAAVCGLETPVYDTTVFPHNVLPIRYKGKMPAPLTIIDNNHWYAYPNIWKNYDYVLVRDWQMSPGENAIVSKDAELVAHYGVYQLWGRK